ncbi:LLM class flavin-dependent oxidoreductase [Streptomyces sp. NPDC052023]|uniref:LLM class flavin-dependent oxidoreductase n=1 Tax=Streptomyces sp. NPDC052023 TaxID=3365681 RepID=UPI0037CD6FB7
MADLAPKGFPGMAAGARHVEQTGLDSVSVSDFVMGNGTPALEATVALSAAAAVTERVELRFALMVLPLRNVAWTAAQIGTLQHLSGNRVVLGVGSGGAPGTPFWQAVGAVPEGRNARLVSSLELLPKLLAGEETTLPDVPGGPTLTLAPAVPAPPVLIGGNSDGAIRRAALYADGWLPSMAPAATVARGTARLREIAEEAGRPAPSTTVWLHAGLGDEESVRTARAAFERSLVDMYGLSPEEAPLVPIGGTPKEAAERFAAYAEAGADHLDLVVDGGDWQRQVELIAEARALL